jgi:hypothetical protein
MYDMQAWTVELLPGAEPHAAEPGPVDAALEGRHSLVDEGEAMVTAQLTPGQLMTVEDAARRLGVEPAAVRLFIRQRLLRIGSMDPLGVWDADVDRLRRVMSRQSAVDLRPRA